MLRARRCAARETTVWTWTFPLFLPPSTRRHAAAECSGSRKARAAELWGRTVTAAQALRQPDCLVVTYLQCLQFHAQVHAVILEDGEEHRGISKQTATRLELACLVELPTILETLKRRAAAGTLDPGTNRAYETEFYGRYAWQQTSSSEADRTAAREAPFLGQDVALRAGMLSVALLPLQLESRQAFDKHERCAFVVSALDLALRHSMAGRWLRTHTMFLDVANRKLKELAQMEASGRFSTADAVAVRDAIRRLSDHAIREHGSRLQRHRNAIKEMQVIAKAASCSAVTRPCALAGCCARELHVAHFKGCAACRPWCTAPRSIKCRTGRTTRQRVRQRARRQRSSQRTSERAHHSMRRTAR